MHKRIFGFRSLVFVLLLAGCLPTGQSGLQTGALPTVNEPSVIVIEGGDALPRPAAGPPRPAALPQGRRAAVGRAGPGILTAGDIDDTLNLAAFRRYQARTAETLNLPRQDLSRPIRAQLRGPWGVPAPGVRVTLRRPGAAAPFYDGYSGVDGRVTVFPAVHGQAGLSAVELRAFVGTDGPEVRQQITTGAAPAVVTLPLDSAWRPDFLDLVFVVDATGSMADELAWLARDLGKIVGEARRAAPRVDIRFGLVVYRAPGDPAPIRSYGFTRDPKRFQRWVTSEPPDGGAGGAEVASDALRVAAHLPWRRGRGERLIFQIGDEPPAPEKTGMYLAAARSAARQGVQVFGLGASGVEAHLELLMRQGAVMTGGRYLFLTDDSGVGRPHGEPAISCYRVTRLSGLVSRILRSELTGRRVEAEPSEVLREVGSYRNGVCRD